MSTEEAVQQELFEAATSPEPPAEPVATEATPEAPSQAPQEPASRPSGPDQSDSIPSWRLREEAEARRQAEDRARTLEQRYNEAMAHWRQQQPQQKAPDFYADPAAYVQAAIQQNLQQHLQPMQAEYHRAIQQLARGQAESVHGPEAVALAEKVFIEARDRRMLDPMDYERVVRSTNRFDACVQWYKRLYALHTVGDDPNAWFDKQFDTKLTSDKQFQATLMEKIVSNPELQAAILGQIRGSAATRPGVTQLPPSLSRSTAAASNGAGASGDLSHESLWASAMTKG